jgi:hypothetical protein
VNTVSTNTVQLVLPNRVRAVEYAREDAGFAYLNRIEFSTKRTGKSIALGAKNWISHDKTTRFLVAFVGLHLSG